MGTWIEQTILERSTNCQQKQKEMFNIPAHQESTNQNNIETSSHPSQKGYHQELRQQQILVRMWGKMEPYTLLWEYKWVQPLIFLRFLKKKKIELPHDLAIPLLGIYLKEHKAEYNGDTAHPCLLQLYSQ
jgi:hypothetical protein